MTNFFISYSRVDLPQIEQLYNRLQRMRPNDRIWYDQAPDGILGGQKWWQKIMDEVARCDIFVYVLSNESVQSVYCQAEFEEARRLQKLIITIQIRDRTRLTDELAEIQYVDMKKGLDDPDAIARLSGAIAHHIPNIPNRSKRAKWRPQTPQPDSKIDELDRSTDAPEVETPTLNLPTREIKQVSDNRSLTETTSSQYQKNSSGTPVFALLLFIMAVAIVGGGIVFFSNVPIPLGEAGNPVTSNDQWTPIEQEFNGVVMVKVPAGCFKMGSEDGVNEETPVHDQCFDKPFWIDKYEVTNEQYGSIICESISSEPDQPRNCIDWFDAKAYCESRDTRLPTEAEWEYAARGPDNLVYPWGNTYIADNVISEDDPIYGDKATAQVGSKSAGVSWVGAMDMSGNLWEWTSSLYESYPYDDSDGREDKNNTSDPRVLRGGSFGNSWFNLRSAYRLRLDPNGGNDRVNGFRCARSN